MNLQKHQASPMVLLSPQQISSKPKNKIIDMQFQNFTSSKISQNKFTDDASITVPTGQSNIESNEENMMLSFINSSSQNKKKVPKQYEKLFRNLKSAEMTKRSQSGEGCMPTSTTSSKPISAQKQSKTNLPSQGQGQQQQQQRNESSSRKGTSVNKNLNGKNVQNNLFKSFHDGSHQMQSNQVQKQNTNSTNKNTMPKFNYEPNLIKVPSLTSTNASSSLSNKFLKSLKIFTANYIVQENQKHKYRKPKTQNREKRDKSEPCKSVPPQKQEKGSSKCEIVKNKQSDFEQSRQMKFGQIMEELEKYSLSKQNEYDQVNKDNFQQTMDSQRMSQRSSTTSFCESVQEFAENGNIRATTYKDQIQREAQRYKSEERAKSEYFSKDFLEKRYVNARVEMELQEFKVEIQKKFEESVLKNYVFKRKEETKAKEYIPQTNQNYEKQYISLDEPHIISCGKESSISKNMPQVLCRSSQKPTQKSKSKKNLDISTDNVQDIDILKTYDFRQQQTTSNKNQENKNLSNFISSASVIVDSKSPHSMIQNVSTSQPSINAIFQSYLKQSIANGEKMLQKQIKEKEQKFQSQNQQIQQQFQMMQQQRQQEADFNQFSKYTLDHPMLTSSFIGMKVGNQNTNNCNTATKQSSIVKQQSTEKKQRIKLQSSSSKMKSKDKNLLQQLTSEKITPKNYSLQLNQVVKKILEDQKQRQETDYQQNNINFHTNQGVQGVFMGLDQQQYDQCFMTTSNERSNKIIKSDYEHLYHTKDNRKTQMQIINNNKLMISDDYHQSDRSSSPLNVKQGSRLDQRSVSNNGSQKSTLINKTRRTKSKISPDKSQDRLLHKDGQSSQVKNVKPMMSINQITQHISSGYNSNISSNRLQKVPSSSKTQVNNGKSSASQSRHPSVNARSSTKNQSKKSIRVTTSSQSQVKQKFPNQVLQNHINSMNNDSQQALIQGTTYDESRMLLKSQVKRSGNLQAEVNQKAVKNLQKKTQNFKQHSLMQRSFHHQVPTNNELIQAKTSTTASPNMTSARGKLQKSRSKAGTNQSSNRGALNIGTALQAQSYHCSNSNFRTSNVVSPTLLANGNRSVLGSRDRGLTQSTNMH